MKKKITGFIRTALDAATKQFMKSMARGAAEDIQEQAAQPTVVEPDLKVRLTSGHEVFQYNVEQSHLVPMVIGLKQNEFVENYDIPTQFISYIVRTPNYWLTVDQTNKFYYISPAILPPFFACAALPEVDVPRG